MRARLASRRIARGPTVISTPSAAQAMTWLTGILSTVRAGEAADRVRVREVLERHGEQLRLAHGARLTGRRTARSVELLDTDGVSLGELDVVQAHTAPGRLHRAFSVVLVDDEGCVLLQR